MKSSASKKTLVSWLALSPTGQGNQHKNESGQISTYLFRAGATHAGSSDLLSTPPEPRAAGYSFREVDDNNGLWAKGRIYKKFQPQLVVFLNKGRGLTVEGLSTHQSPSDVITTSSSESDSADTDTSSDEQSDSGSTTSTDSSLSEDEDGDQGGKRTATTFVNVKVGCQASTMAAMPSVHKKDVSISARNHEPDSLTQFADNHERRPLAETEPPSKFALEAMELLASVKGHRGCARGGHSEGAW
jgi:hypothetical protein